MSSRPSFQRAIDRNVISKAFLLRNATFELSGPPSSHNQKHFVHPPVLSGYDTNPPCDLHIVLDVLAFCFHFSHLVKDVIPCCFPPKAVVRSVYLWRLVLCRTLCAFFFSSDQPVSYSLFFVQPPSTISFLATWTRSVIPLMIGFSCEKKCLQWLLPKRHLSTLHTHVWWPTFSLQPLSLDF